tara:strand:- start:27 stop:1112 length:1086 start_codon:yes stop_codon:yes gene_type:complete
MIIGSLSENKNVEKRVAITPDVIKKYKLLGFEVHLNKDYATHIGISDDEYVSLGATISSNNEIISNANAMLQMNILDVDNSNKLHKDQFLIGVLNPYLNEKRLKEISSKGVNCFSLELLPRITRAQSMDILSSQANLAGYKAVVDSFAYYQKAIPMMMTAAGTIPAAKVLVLGAGVAGLQAIATAKRMGAIVFATDVRLASKEQVESLGGKFLIVDGAENLETQGGYAKEASEEFKKKQEDLLKETLKKIDIVICTALIPGKKAPLILRREMINVMPKGSIIYDLAASQGGNSELTKVDEVVDANGVKIMGETNILNKLPVSSSNLYSKNLYNFIDNLYDNEKKVFNINLDDEIIKKTMVK